MDSMGVNFFIPEDGIDARSYERASSALLIPTIDTFEI